MIDWKAMKTAADVAPDQEGFVDNNARMNPVPPKPQWMKERDAEYWKGFRSHFKDPKSYADALYSGAVVAPARTLAKTVPAIYGGVSYPVSWFGHGINLANYLAGRITPEQYRRNAEDYSAINFPAEWMDRQIDRYLPYPERLREDPGFMGVMNTTEAIGSGLTAGRAVGKAQEAARAYRDARATRKAVEDAVQAVPDTEFQFDWGGVTGHKSPLTNQYAPRGRNDFRHVYNMQDLAEDVAEGEVNQQVADLIEKAKNDPKLFFERVDSAMPRAWMKRYPNRISLKKDFVDQTRDLARARGKWRPWENTEKAVGSINTPEQAGDWLNRTYRPAGGDSSKLVERLSEDYRLPAEWIGNESLRETARRMRIDKLLHANTNPVMTLQQAIDQSGPGQNIYKGWMGKYDSLGDALGHWSQRGSWKASSKSPRWWSPLEEVPLTGGAYTGRGGSYAVVKLPKDMEAQVMARNTPHVAQAAPTEEAAQILRNRGATHGGRYADLSSSPDYETAIPWRDMRRIMKESPHKKLYEVMGGEGFPNSTPGRLRTDPPPAGADKTLLREVMKPVPDPRYAVKSPPVKPVVGALPPNPAIDKARERLTEE